MTFECTECISGTELEQQISREGTYKSKGGTPILNIEKANCQGRIVRGRGEHITIITHTQGEICP